MLCGCKVVEGDLGELGTNRKYPKETRVWRRLYFIDEDTGEEVAIEKNGKPLCIFIEETPNKRTYDIIACPEFILESEPTAPAEEKKKQILPVSAMSKEQIRKMESSLNDLEKFVRKLWAQGKYSQASELMSHYYLDIEL